MLKERERGSGKEGNRALSTHTEKKQQINIMCLQKTVYQCDVSQDDGWAWFIDKNVFVSVCQCKTDKKSVSLVCDVHIHMIFFFMDLYYIFMHAQAMSQRDHILFFPLSCFTFIYHHQNAGPANQRSWEHRSAATHILQCQKFRTSMRNAAQNAALMSATALTPELSKLANLIIKSRQESERCVIPARKTYSWSCGNRSLVCLMCLPVVIKRDKTWTEINGNLLIPGDLAAG